MTDRGTYKVRPERYCVRNEPPHEVHRYLDITGRITLTEMLAAVTAEAPSGVSLDAVTLSGCVVWTEPATEEDLARWDESDRRLAERIEAGERRAYERLRAKYGDEPQETP